MLKAIPLAVSVLLHAAVIGTAAVLLSRCDGGGEKESRELAMFFETVDMQALSGAAEEKSGPPPSGKAAPPEEPQETGKKPIRSDAAPPAADIPGGDAAGSAPRDADGSGEADGTPEPPETDAVQEPPEAAGGPAADTAPAHAAETSPAGEHVRETLPVERAAVVQAPCAIGRIEPAYPRSARRKGHEGRVSLDLTISPDGTVSSADVADSSGFKELDSAALSAARKAKFSPATEDDRPVEGSVRISFDFKLK